MLSIYIVFPVAQWILESDLDAMLIDSGSTVDEIAVIVSIDTKIEMLEHRGRIVASKTDGAFLYKEVSDDGEGHISPQPEAGQ